MPALAVVHGAGLDWVPGAAAHRLRLALQGPPTLRVFLKRKRVAWQSGSMPLVEDRYALSALFQTALHQRGAGLPGPQQAAIARALGSAPDG